MKIGRERIGVAIIGLFCLAYTILSFDIPSVGSEVDRAMTARSMPLLLGLLSCTLCICLMFRPTPTTPIAWRTLSWRKFILLVGLMSLYGITLRPLGFVGATFAFLLTGFLVMGAQRWLVSAAIALAITLCFWALLNFGLGVYMPALPSVMSDL